MIRRLLTRRPAPAVYDDLDREGLEKALTTAHARVEELERQVRHLLTVNERLAEQPTGPMPAVEVAAIPSGSHLELLLRERATNRRLADEVHRLTLASIAADRPRGWLK